MPEIGETLRDARMRARIDVSEIEAKTKIRAKYLRALENEEWGLLPGPTFVKSFLRTYAQALGLDGKALVEEYRVSHEGLTEAALEPIVSSPQHSRSPGAGRAPTGPSRGYIVVIAVVGVLIILLVVGLLTGGGGGSSKHTDSTASSAKGHQTRGHHASGRTSAPASARSTTVTMSLRPTAAVYVCLIGDGRKLIAGSELLAGANTPTFHARHFEITLGNSSLTMIIDGKARTVPPSSQAIGYSITKATGRRPLPAGRLPTCK
jgi:cytoskeleton protein RodZ